MTDETTIAAHAYRDGKIFFTVTITSVMWGYRINREDTGHLLGMAGSEQEAKELADMYLLGITTGYDLGIEHAWKECPRHQRPLDFKPTPQRNLRCCGGDPSCACEH